jgi:small subunit ribosomal protein S15
MAVTKEQRTQIVKQFQRADSDTGSPEVQVALLTSRINELSAHFTAHKKDKHGVRGLMKIVSRRRKLLDYLKINNKPRYETLLKELDIRK